MLSSGTAKLAGTSLRGIANAMFRLRALRRLLISLLAMLYLVGSSGAVLACVSPPHASGYAMPSKGSCNTQSKSHDCQIACAPMCVGVAPATVLLEAPQIPPYVLLERPAISLLACQTGPEPPPPRSA